MSDAVGMIPREAGASGTLRRSSSVSSNAPCACATKGNIRTSAKALRGLNSLIPPRSFAQAEQPYPRKRRQSTEIRSQDQPCCTPREPSALPQLCSWLRSQCPTWCALHGSRWLLRRAATDRSAVRARCGVSRTAQSPVQTSRSRAAAAYPAWAPTQDPPISVQCRPQGEHTVKRRIAGSLPALPSQRWPGSQ